jgi:hypothetical protein
MLPSQLTAESFAKYPPEARQLATGLIPTLGAYFGFDARFSSGKPVAEVA